MDFLWSPWRSQYVSSEQSKPCAGCIFCYFSSIPSIESQPGFDDKHFILKRGVNNFILLNLYPYTSGHLMVVPYDHSAELFELSKAITDEMMDLAKMAQHALAIEYKPAGFNLGMNLGSAAGAGIAGHLHLHLLPRWTGDANFMTTIGETRVLPESLADTYQRLKPHFL